ncbi:putative porphyromonas-type peptidyl-arginine deiminase [Xylogone sp. PMI_703]|nr:putative porphyromonas-type peptidyl-arginine deiminase [Xylogone sp. PMI_703]
MEPPTPAISAKRYIYPADTARHSATILGFPSKVSIAPAYYDDACDEIVRLAAAVSDFEPVRVYARPEDTPIAQSMIDKVTEKQLGITLIPIPTNHLWVRDTGPVYVQAVDEGSRHQRFAINFKFNEWGKKDSINNPEYASDGVHWPVMMTEELEDNAAFAQRVISGDTLPSPVIEVQSKICLEGGALVVDGEGTLLATESSILNENRNPGLSCTEVEDELRRLLGVKKIIWFPGRKDLDVTDVHIDAELSIIRPGVVVLSRPHPSAPQPWKEIYEEISDILKRETDAKGRHFEIHTIDEPDPECLLLDPHAPYEDPATNYVNFYFVNGGLIVPLFGDKLRDQEVMATMQRVCPDRVVRGVSVRALPLTGGVLHCATQPVIDIEVN